MTQFSAAKLANIALRLRALGEPTRIRIVEALAQGEQPVSQVVKALKADQSNVSKHLQVLYHAGLVKRRRSGNTVLYSLVDPALVELCRAMGALPQRKLRLASRWSTLRARAQAADPARRPPRRARRND